MTSKEEGQNELNLTAAHHDYEKGLNLYASSKVSNRVLGEDLVQETFLKTWGYLARGGKIDIMKAFLYHVLNDLVVDQYRKHKTASLDQLLQEGFEPSSGDTNRLFNILDGRAALLLIQRLPKTYQHVMRMRYAQDLSLKEMALITGQSKNAVAVQAHRGLKHLKSIYGLK